MMSIKKATILGAGTMGSQIAALLVNAGLKVQLLDIVIDENNPNKISKKAYETITDKKRPLLYDLSFASNLSYGNFNDDLKNANDADIYIEAVKEDLDIKHQVWKQVASVAKEDALFATNTSGIPIEYISKIFNDSERERFFGLHFFNPPRFMKLVEVIPTRATSKKIMTQVRNFVEEKLGKGVVVANDVPGFVANRIGTQTMNDIMYRAEQQGLSFTDVDALTGRAIGRPSTGTYGLVDLVGLDIATAVIKGLQQIPEEKEFFKDVKVADQLFEKGAYGRKTKQGFYKKDKETGKILVLDPQKEEYVEQQKPQLPILAKFNKDIKNNLDVIFESKDKDGVFLWETLRNNFYYSAVNVPKATEDFKNIDRAIVWGFNWKLGPFQLWDLIGFDRVKARMEKELGELPEWISNRTTPFYEKGETLESVTPVSELIEREIWNKQDSNLSVVKKNQLLLKLQSDKNIVTDDFNDDLVEAINLLENDEYSSMVIYAEGRNFSVGANINLMKQAHEEGIVDEAVGPSIDKLHYSFNRLKYSTKPVVTAVQGMALGGGCELVLYSPYVVAASETYIGLVESGIGLLPSGGGLAEMADRILSTSHKMDDKMAYMTKALTNIGFAKVSSNAYEAKRYGYLRDTDSIILNQEARVEVALDKARFLSETNYMAPPEHTYIALGADYKALAEGQLEAQLLGHYISKHDYKIAVNIAGILSGGELPRNTYINQRYIQSLEKVGFIELLKTEKTYERIKHMLKTGKPLRN